MATENDRINLAMVGPRGAHEHDYGPVEHAFLTGEPHRKCRVDGCAFISLDLYPERDGDPYWVVKGLDKVYDAFGHGQVFDARDDAVAYARAARGVVVEYEHADAIGSTVVADYRDLDREA